VKSEVERAIRAEAPEVTPTVTANPVALDDESALERVLLISARRRLAVHHVTIQEVDGARAVSLDLELDGHMSLGAAHEIASGLEEAIKTELGADVEVETHIEPMEADELEGHDVGERDVAAIAHALGEAARAGARLTTAHNVRARATASGVVVNYHCNADPALSVDAVHAAVDEVDRRLRAEFSEVTRVVGHAEPPGA
jgi:divalent metal cation (Fe/Co/Zn/Cd) transporter